MAEKLSLDELDSLDPEQVSNTCAVLRGLAQGRINKLPEEIHGAVQSVTFRSADKGKPMSPEANIAEIKVGQIFSPWILVDLKDAIGTRHVRILLNEDGEINRCGNFKPSSEKPGFEMGAELVGSIDFYESLLSAAASEVAVSVD